MAAPLLFVCVIFALRGASLESQAHTNLTFMMIVDMQHGFNSSGALPAVDMALEDINRNPNILSGYNLMYDKVRDSMAAKRGLTYPRYVWMAYDWYPREWWKQSEGNDMVDCDTEQLQKFLERAISLRRYPTPDDNTKKTEAGITPDAFEVEYTKRANEGGFEILDVGVRLYDIMWMLAIALNNTLSMVRSGDISETGCGNVTGSLVPLEEFNYSNERMGCLIQWNLQTTDYTGVSGHILLDKNGTRIHHTVRLRQYLFDESGNLTRQWFAHLDRTDNYTFTFEAGYDDNRVFPDGIPLDGSPEVSIHTFEIELVIVFDVLATVGIVFAIGCLLFNFIFRERKLVKLSSPSLNYFIIIGAVLMYISIFFYTLPVIDTDVVLASCILQHWLFTIGYSLAFGMVLAKMWRVYQIFHNPTPNKKVLRDWHLLAATMVVTGTSVLLLLLETAIPQLRGKVTQEVDQENPSGMTSLGIREQFFVLVCYEASSPNFFWQIFIFAYLVVLQIIGIILSFQTRKVKLQGLNDSKYITTIVYFSSIVIVVLALVTFSLRTYINIGTGIFVAGIFILTTIFLALIFIPKMVLLYKNPNRDSALEKSRHVSSMDGKAGTKVTTFKVDSDLESKVTSLQRMLKKRDDTIVQLRDQIEMMKDQVVNGEINKND